MTPSSRHQYVHFGIFNCLYIWKIAKSIIFWYHTFRTNYNISHRSWWRIKCFIWLFNFNASHLWSFIDAFQIIYKCLDFQNWYLSYKLSLVAFGGAKLRFQLDLDSLNTLTKLSKLMLWKLRSWTFPRCTILPINQCSESWFLFSVYPHCRNQK